MGCDRLSILYNVRNNLISTHTSRVGCDAVTTQYSYLAKISTHTSRVGCDMMINHSQCPSKFLLTHPVWDVTKSRYRQLALHKFLLTHPVWDVTRKMGAGRRHTRISTHTSRVGCDDDELAEFRDRLISTHTSRVGCDAGIGQALDYVTNFYSHIPCGMWPWLQGVKNPVKSFLLTHPVWDVTTRQPRYNRYLSFLLTHPVWDVTLMSFSSSSASSISTHTSRVGCDGFYCLYVLQHIISTHTSRVGCD